MPIPWRLSPFTNNAPLLDKRDKSIISILQQNARVTLQDIATHLQVTKAAALYRITKLEESGVIQGYQTHFGLDLNNFSHVLVEISNPSPRQSFSTWLSEISARPETMVVFSSYGPFNTLAAIGFPSDAKNNSFEKWCHSSGMRSCKSHPIFSAELTPLDYTGSRISLSAVIRRRQPCFLNAFSNFSPRKITIPPEKLRIAQILQQDARTPLSTIAEKVGISRANVYKTIDEWIRAGFITKFSATINPFVFPGIRFCAVWVSFRNKNDIQKWKKNISTSWNGHGFLSLRGKWSAVSFLHFFSEEEVLSFEEKLRSSFPSLKDYRIDFLRGQTKLDWLAPLITAKMDTP